MAVYIIAEAGVNHNGSVETAKEMIRVARRTGCDCIKFQTFRTEDIVTRSAPKAEYQVKNVGASQSQYEMLRSLELSATDFSTLCDYCKEKGIDFLSTPFDSTSATLLKGLGISTWKLASGEITNKPLIQQIGAYHARVILSTGMSTLEETEAAVGWLREAGTEDISLLHCTSNYPTSPEDVNMRAMLTLRAHFGLPVGYSDHTEGIDIPLMAVAMGATIIEKHFTLDRDMAGPDHKASLEPEGLAQMVRSIRRIESAFGDGEKKPTHAERSTRIAARKSIVLARPVLEGIPLTDADIAIKRPGTGIAPSRLSEVIGRRPRYNMEEGRVLSFSDLIEEAR